MPAEKPIQALIYLDFYFGLHPDNVGVPKKIKSLLRRELKVVVEKVCKQFPDVDLAINIRVKSI